MPSVVQDLVVDIGDVAREDDVVPTGGQPPAQNVESDGSPKVPDVRGCLHGRPAYVDADASGLDWRELTGLPAARVVQLQRHTPRLPAYALAESLSRYPTFSGVKGPSIPPKRRRWRRGL